MAEADTVSNASSTPSSVQSGLSDVPVVQHDAADLTDEADSELQDAAGRLEAVTLDLNTDIGQKLRALDSESLGDASTSSSHLPDSGDSDDDNGSNLSKPSEDGKDVNGAHSAGSGSDKKSKKAKEGSGKKGKNPLRLLKKLTKYDKPKKKETFSEFDKVRIDKLPQVFVAKYLGMRKVRGFCGLHHVRQPVDEMVGQVQQNLEKQQQVELPLVYVIVSPKGLDVREHKLNKQKTGIPTGLVPIDFISYGVQDIKYWRVFTYIVVRELSSRSKVTECHAYLCDSSLNARKMALSLGASFKIYSRGLKKEGKDHNFQVELRPPDELVDALADEDCDA